MPSQVFRLGDWVPDKGEHFNVDGSHIGVVDSMGWKPAENGWRVAPYLKASSAYQPTVGPEKGGGIIGYAIPDATTFAANRLIYANGTSLYYYDLTTETDVTRSGGAYSTTPRQNWQFCVYNNKVLATNGADAIQTKAYNTTADFAKNNVLTTDTTADPRAKFICTFKNHVFIANFDLTSGTSGGESYGGAYGALTATTYPTGVWWSQLDNETRWASPIVHPKYAGSDYKLLQDTQNGPIRGMCAATDYVFLAREKGITIMAGPPFGETVTVDSTTTGILPNTLVPIGNDVYFLCNRGVAVLRGGRTVEYLQVGANSEFMLAVDGYLSGYNTSSGLYDHFEFCRGTANKNGDTIYWTIKARRSADPETGLYDRMICLDVARSKAFIIGKFDGTDSGVAFTVHDLWGVVTLPVQTDTLQSSYDEGVFAFGDMTWLATRAETFAKLARQEYSMALTTNPRIRTAAISIGENGEPGQTWRPKRIRPIANVGVSRHILKTTPTHDKLFSEIRIYPKRTYWGADRNDVGGTSLWHSPTSGTYFTFSNDQIDSMGWWTLEGQGLPFALCHAIEFYGRSGGGASLTSSNAVTAANIFLFHGFELEYETGGVLGEGVEFTDY